MRQLCSLQVALVCGAPALSGPIHEAARNADLATARLLLKSDPDFAFSGCRS